MVHVASEMLQGSAGVVLPWLFGWSRCLVSAGSMWLDCSVTAVVCVEPKRQRPEPESQTKCIYLHKQIEMWTRKAGRLAEWSGCNEGEFRVSRWRCELSREVLKDLHMWQARHTRETKSSHRNAQEPNTRSEETLKRWYTNPDCHRHTVTHPGFYIYIHIYWKLLLIWGLKSAQYSSFNSN